MLISGVSFFIISKSRNQSAEIPAGLEYPIYPLSDAPMDFSSYFSLFMGDEVVFTDGLKIKLKEINDSRCKEGAMCVWQGELSYLISVSGGKIKVPAELRLGTENFKTQNLDGYTFSLEDATEKYITLSVTYKAPVITSGGCYVGGCSGQICSDQQDVMSNCEFKEEYACYNSARCERQNNRKCGWTQTPALQACLAEK